MDTDRVRFMVANHFLRQCVFRLCKEKIILGQKFHLVCQEEQETVFG